ncbi:hypothetical protein [Candidatus Atelocyanobacterium thalassae]|uniref:Uncharacterized protein n=1 Tax=Candidatus Atelocyanobacterium thalassa isolate SIO64986 TaxID=1527444 RepID=A0A086CG35_9CHRO|nr:hypothetical protein [Candidatus Atelocyanobacterium thalassa]KFF41149.1 MAG: hypothetical protein ucyna2_01056 [Candidatus Atelocyanobacterium thalassa isolate SIO64986]
MSLICDFLESGLIPETSAYKALKIGINSVNSLASFVQTDILFSG